MNTTFVIRCSAIAAVASLVAITSTAAAGHLPRPLGPGHQPLSPGVHVFDLVSRKSESAGPSHLPRIAVTLPSGWSNYDGWAVLSRTAQLGFWAVNKVYPTPCAWKSKPMVDPGRTVGGLARALAAQPLRNASKPTNVKLAGFRGKYLRWSVPSGIDFASCDEGYFESWTAVGWASDRYEQAPGQVDRLWILSVKRQRLLIDASYLPGATRKQRAQLDRIVHSIRFLAGSPRKPASGRSG